MYMCVYVLIISLFPEYSIIYNLHKKYKIYDIFTNKKYIKKIQPKRKTT